MEFIVYYIYDDKEATIHARSAKDAAIKFIIKYPRDDDSQIRVEVKKSWTQDDDSIFNTLDLFPEVAISRNNPIQTILEKNILEDFEIPIFEEVIERHPGWLNYSRSNKEGDIIEIIIPCSIKENPPIVIWFEGGEISPCVSYSKFRYDSYNLNSISGASMKEFWGNNNHLLVADAIDEIVQRITSEELIATIWKTTFGSSDLKLIDCDRYRSLKEQNKIIRSFSWLGTYNFGSKTEQ